MLSLSALHAGTPLFTQLFSFDGTNGTAPVGSLVQGLDGALYGVTHNGGAYSNGTVFKIQLDGTFTLLSSFDGTNGATPNALVCGADGNFYGTTWMGGEYNTGTVFQVTPGGSVQVLFSFNGGNGSSPAGLMRGTDGNVYGVTELGGSFTDPLNMGCGTVFRMTPQGTLTTLAAFDGNNGDMPVAALLQAGDGNFYGVTRYGGTFSGFFGPGTAFKMEPSGALTSLDSFDGISGANSTTPLVEGSDGAFYGTSLGGTNHSQCCSLGNIFRLHPDGTLESIFSFNGTNGFTPAGLVRGDDGNFYGATGLGGFGFDGSAQNRGSGTLFQVTPQGQLTTLYMFTNNDEPSGALFRASDGCFYGTTTGGGTFGYGTIFRLAVPMAPTVMAALGPGGTLVLSWSAVASQSYQVQYKNNLADANWQNLGGPITATTGSDTASDVVGQLPSRFYRVVLLP